MSSIRYALSAHLALADVFCRRIRQIEQPARRTFGDESSSAENVMKGLVLTACAYPTIRMFSIMRLVVNNQQTSGEHAHTHGMHSASGGWSVTHEQTRFSCSLRLGNKRLVRHHCRLHCVRSCVKRHVAMIVSEMSVCELRNRKLNCSMINNQLSC